MQQISKLVRRQDGIKKRESQIPSDYYVDSFKKKERRDTFYFRLNFLNTVKSILLYVVKMRIFLPQTKATEFWEQSTFVQGEQDQICGAQRPS